MKKLLFLLLFLNNSNLISGQNLELDKMQQCIGKHIKNIEEILVTNNYEFVKFDSTKKILTYKYSTTLGDREAGSRFCDIYQKNDTTDMIRYTTLDKQEYFDWVKYLKFKNYSSGQPKYDETKKTEYFGLKKYAVMIETEPADAIEIKMKINKYCLFLVLLKTIIEN